jgi:hypothetical protein
MLQIARTENSKTTAVIYKVNYTQLYNQLKVVLPKELISLFAKPDIGEKYTIWTSDSFSDQAQLKTFSALSEKEKNDAASQLEEKKDEIVSILANHPTLGALAENLFIISEEDDIKYVSDGSFSSVVLSRWGSKSNVVKTTINPLTTVINRPGNKRSEVCLHTKYKDGDFASSIELSVEYKGAVKNYQTDELGQVALGRFLHGSVITVFFGSVKEKLYQHTFSIDEGIDYHIQIPKTADLIIETVNQDGNPIVCDVELDYKNSKTVQKTNGSGMLIVEDLEYGERIDVFATFFENSASAGIQISGPDNRLRLVLKEPRPSNLLIKTLDQFDNPLSTDIGISADGKIQQYQTNTEGIVYLKGIYEIAQVINIFAEAYQFELSNYKITEKEHELVLRLRVPELKALTVKLLDFNKQPLPALKIDFASKNIKEPRTTDADAICRFNQGDFIHNEKIKARIHYPKKKKNGDVKTVFYSKSFRYDENRHEYILQLRRRNWWWLLLLLIPLLLIQCEKEIPVKVFYEDSLPVKNAAISLEYKKQNLFRPWALFAVDPQKKDSLSSEKGYVIYKKIRYSIYSLIFYNFTRAKFSASLDCYRSDTIHYFHYLPDTVRLKMKILREKKDFLVIDSLSNEPIPEALLIIRSKYRDKEFIDTLYSDKNGKVIGLIPSCGTDISIIAKKGDYLPGKLYFGDISDMVGDENIKIKLKSKKARPNCPDRELVFQVCNANRAKDDYFEVFLNDGSIGFLDLGSNDLVGSVFIASNKKKYDIKEPDFICPMAKMKVYYFDSDLVKFGENKIYLKNLKKNNNGNRGTISVRNYKIVDNTLISPCMISDMDFGGADGESFESVFILTECCEK